MNKFRYNKADNKLLLDIERPNPLHFGDDQEFNPKYQEKLKAWNSRLSYSLSKELRDKLTNGQVYQPGEHFHVANLSRDCKCEHCEIMRKENSQYIAIPLPEQTKKKESANLVKAMIDFHGLGNEQTSKVKEPERFTLEDMIAAVQWPYRTGKVHPGNNMKKDSAQYFKETFGIDIKNNQPSNT